MGSVDATGIISLPGGYADFGAYPIFPSGKISLIVGRGIESVGIGVGRVRVMAQRV